MKARMYFDTGDMPISLWDYESGKTGGTRSTLVVVDIYPGNDAQLDEYFFRHGRVQDEVLVEDGQSVVSLSSDCWLIRKSMYPSLRYRTLFSIRSYPIRWGCGPEFFDLRNSATAFLATSALSGLDHEVPPA